jgi:predicted GIY-YIG superfamily endonuclease
VSAAEALMQREKELKGWSRKKKFELIDKARGKPFAQKAGSG